MRAPKFLLPNHPVPTRVWRGPFRGARVVMNPRHSLRKILGLYEHELNTWLEEGLRRVDRVIDVGANDGYFTFGCAAAFRRLGKRAEIIAVEPLEHYLQILRRGISHQPDAAVGFTLVRGLAGRESRSGMIALDSLAWECGHPADRSRALIKIDVEGAEMDVLAGGVSWVNSGNCFLIEVHRRAFLEPIQAIFAAKGLTLDRVNQRPLRFIGREVRDEENSWLVSRLQPLA